jgi:nucleotide-binding universal stress UspA family protein
MAMTTVLVQVDSGSSGQSAVEAAFLAARKDGGHVVGVYVTPHSEQTTAENMALSHASIGMPGQDIQTALHNAEKRGGPEALAARRCFEDIAGTMGADILERPPNPGHLTACFAVLEENGSDTLAELGRIFDLVVVRQPKNDQDHRLRKMLRSVLFHAGRPVLVAPEARPVTLGKRLMIAWNKSALSARAAAISRNFFDDVEEVGILSIASKGGTGPTAHDLSDYLEWHGLKARVIEAELGKDRLGDVMLSEAERFGADLLVMGAYSQSPFRESLTGGVTNYVLSKAELPVLMSH